MELVVKCFDREKALKEIKICEGAYVTPCEGLNTLNLHIPNVQELYVLRTGYVQLETSFGYILTLKYSDYLNLEIH